MLCIAALTWGTVTFITPYIAYLYDDHTVTLLLLGLFRVILGLFQGMIKKYYMAFILIVIYSKYRFNKFYNMITLKIFLTL